MRGLYIHIPFCKQICSYCDFPKQVAKEDVQKEYIHHLIEEIRSYKEELKDIRSVYIGGGTPNSISFNLLDQLFCEIAPILKTSIENTIEINSELLTKQQALLFKKYNINRVSIGAQTFSEPLIKVIRRGHNFLIVKKAVEILKEVGIQNINIDMMYGLPNQTIEDLKLDLDQLFDLEPQHISYYSLILEEKTILSYQIKHYQISLPDDDYVADMANYIAQRLKKSKFRQYEISNYALKGYESIHNIGYWKCEEYIGVGAGACSYIHQFRIQNHVILKDYYAQYIKEKEWISPMEAKKEYMLLGFRMIKGISKEAYFKRFFSKIEDDFDLDKLYEKNLIEETNEFIYIKEDKLLLGNLVFEEFVG